jgi:hypothetical protein
VSNSLRKPQRQVLAEPLRPFGPLIATRQERFPAFGLIRVEELLQGDVLQQRDQSATTSETRRPAA